MGRILFLLLMVYAVYRLSKPGYEKKYQKELRFRDMFDPKNWDKL